MCLLSPHYLLYIVSVACVDFRSDRECSGRRFVFFASSKRARAQRPPELPLLWVIIPLWVVIPQNTTGIELNQGDTIGGTVGRADVAEVVVEAALSPAAENTIFEVYGKTFGLQSASDREIQRDGDRGTHKRKRGGGTG